MELLIVNIKELAGVEENPVLIKSGKEMAETGRVPDAFLYISGSKINDFGKMSDLNRIVNFPGKPEPETVDASGKFVFPSFCDPHTHLVFAAGREQEFVDRINGLSYEEIARRGGGILNSSQKLHETSEDELFTRAMIRIDEIIAQGTGAVEIKSGYGLNTEDELKMLRVIRRIKEESLVEVRSTFLGAHAVPEAYKNDRERYIEIIINEMIPLVAAGDLADYIDVFCDKGFFSIEETERIIMAGIKYGLLPKLHANELGNTGGVQVGVKYNALSVDHLERAGDDEIQALKGSDTIPVLLPGSAFFLNLPDPPARKIIDSGLPVAMASDFNPGSSPSGNMKLVMSLGCIRLKMTPEEAFNAVTLNSAAAMGISETHGSIARGKTANLFITKEMNSFSFFPYSYGSNLIEKVVLKGKIIK